MNILKRIKNQLNVVGQCRKSGLSIWQCPQFLFILMGIFIVITISIAYLIGARLIEDPETVALVIIIITTILLIISFIVTSGFEKLAEGSRLKSEFVNIVSHQLRSPLTNIKWAFEILSSKELNVDQKKKGEYFINVKENIARMVELIDDLLIVSKIEEGAFSIHKKEIDLKNVMGDLVTRYKVFAKASDIDLTFIPDENIPDSVMADTSMLKLVVENLIDNAIRYTKGGGKIEVKFKKRNRNIIFSIKDEGVGIPEKDKAFIFRKFFRAENALKQRTRGSGLGLYVCKTIIKESGGKIWFDSKENKGTTFYFTLPI